MPGLLTVTNTILGDIDRGSSTALNARISRAITDAIHYHRNTRYGWNTKRKTFLVSAEYTSLTANWIETDGLTLQISSTDTNVLCEKPWDWIHRRFDPNDSDEPTHFAIQNHQLRLWTAPDRTYSVEMVYHFDLAPDYSLSNSFSTAWLNEGEQMIRMHAQGDVLINYIRGPEQIAEGERCMAAAMAIQKRLKSRANREQGSGMLQPFL